MTISVLFVECSQISIKYVIGYCEQTSLFLYNGGIEIHNRTMLDNIFKDVEDEYKRFLEVENFFNKRKGFMWLMLDGQHAVFQLSVDDQLS